MPNHHIPLKPHLMRESLLSKDLFLTKSLTPGRLMPFLHHVAAVCHQISEARKASRKRWDRMLKDNTLMAPKALTRAWWLQSPGHGTRAAEGGESKAYSDLASCSPSPCYGVSVPLPGHQGRGSSTTSCPALHTHRSTGSEVPIAEHRCRSHRTGAWRGTRT